MSTATIPNGAATEEIELTPELVQQLMKLPDFDRAKLAHLMWDSLEGPPDDPEEVKEAWRAEIARRIEDYQAGRAKTYSEAEFFERLQERLHGSKPT